MSGSCQAQTPVNSKRELEESSDDDVVIVSPYKRHHKESRASRSAVAMSVAALKVPDAILQAYQHMLPGNPKGIMFLFSTRFSEALDVPAARVATEYRTTKEKAIEELRRLLVIKVFMADESAHKISPTPLMDELWHAAILDTQLYADLHTALGVFLHHRPSGASEQESKHREKRLTTMKAMYRAFFSTEPIEHVPLQSARPLQIIGPQDPITIFIQTQGGITYTFKARPSLALSTIQDALEKAEDITWKQYRLLFNGSRVGGTQTLEQCDIEDGDTLEMHMELCGC